VVTNETSGLRDGGATTAELPRPQHLGAPTGWRGGVAGRCGVAEEKVSQATYQLLVSGEDGRYHAVWDRDIAVAGADPRQTTPPAAVCGKRRCKPYDEARMAQPVACDTCFHWLRENAPDAECVGAPRRNLAECDRTELSAAR
jgi:hypothetical protein